LRQHRPKQLDRFYADGGRADRGSGHVTDRVCQVLYQVGHRDVSHAGEDDRDGGGLLMCGSGSYGIAGDQNIHRQLDELRG
jgi:hypothetical protein